MFVGMCVCVEEEGEEKINEKETWREYIIVGIIKNIKNIIVRIVWLCNLVDAHCYVHVTNILESLLSLW